MGSKTVGKLGLSICCAAVGAGVLLSGCSAVSTLPTSSETPLSNGIARVSGVAHGGQNPVSGTAVTLYATGSSYGTGATVLGTATTGSDGSFTITPNGNSCSGQAYIVASGGNPGLPGTVDNTAIDLVAALGNCSSVNSATSVQINELTTVAAAYALSGFASPTSLNIGTSSTNTVGLQDAFLNAANLVNYSTGAALATTPGGNGTVPTAVINTLGDILQDCVNSSGPSSMGCANLFADAQPPAATGIALPVNVWQAALDIAEYPATNAAALFNLVSSQAAFMPDLSGAPNDWSIGIEYSMGESEGASPSAVSHPAALTVDVKGNVWADAAEIVSGTQLTGSPLVEMASNGNLLSPAGGYGYSAFAADATALTTQNAGTATGAIALRQMAVDTLGNIWMADSSNGLADEYVPGTSTLNSYNAFGTVNNKSSVGYTMASSLAIDSNNNVFYGTQKSGNSNGFIGELLATDYTTCYFCVDLYKSTQTSFTGDSSYLTVDATTGNVFAVNVYMTEDNVIEMPNTGTVGAPAYTAPTAASNAIATANQDGATAIDKSGNTWVVSDVVGSDGGALYEIPAASAGTEGTLSGSSYTLSSGGTGLDDSRGLSIDGNNRLFIANYAGGTIAEFDPATSNFYVNPTSEGIDPVDTNGSPVLANPAAGTTFGVHGVAVDAAGALWIPDSQSNIAYGVVQILGIAAPVNPVLANGKYGVKP